MKFFFFLWIGALSLLKYMTSHALKELEFYLPTMESAHILVFSPFQFYDFANIVVI